MSFSSSSKVNILAQCGSHVCIGEKKNIMMHGWTCYHNIITDSDEWTFKGGKRYYNTAGVLKGSLFVDRCMIVHFVVRFSWMCAVMPTVLVCGS